MAAAERRQNMEITLIRHFRTPGNGRGQYIGSTEESIDPAGIPRNIPRFRRPDILAVSPMRRCIQTASLLYPGMEMAVYPQFREMDFGEYEGKTYEELKDEPAYQRWMESGGLTAFPGGEDRESFQRRCLLGMEKLLQESFRQGYERAAVVAHGGTLMAVLSACSPGKESFYHWQVENGGGYQAEADGEEWLAGRRIFRRIRRIGREAGSRDL